MKTCPVCNAHYEDTEIVCPDCYSHQILLETPETVPDTPEDLPQLPGYFQFTIDFFNHSLSLFTIIGIIVTILTLFPVFVTFILGDNWFNLLLADPNVGFLSLRLIWIATFFGALFVYCLMALIIIDFLNQIQRSQHLHISEILFALAILSLVVISIGSLISFLWLVWFNKSDLIVYFHGLNLLLLTMVPAFIIIISGIVRIYSGWLKDPIFLEVKNSLNSHATKIKNYVNNRRVKTSVSSHLRGFFSIIYAGKSILLVILLIILTIVMLYMTFG